MTKIAGACDPAVALRIWLQSEIQRTLQTIEGQIGARLDRLETLLIERPVPKRDARYGAALRAALADIADAINEQKYLNGD
ncbi:MAG: hypothetical protein ACYDC3_10350 [Candidatus Binataceae bacterium]